MPVFRKMKRELDNWFGRLSKAMGDAVLFLCAVVLLAVCVSMQQKAYEVTAQLNETLQASAAAAEEPRKVAFLTFDDGPSKNTRQVLDILKENEIHATFFVIGSEITPEREELLREMVEEGHSIGIHTYSHKKNEIYRSLESCLEDLQMAADRVCEVTGQCPRIMRFPYGSNNPYMKSFEKEVKEKVQEEGLVYYDWNVSGEDAVGNPTSYSILQHIKEDLTRYNEPVILLHDGVSNKLTADTLSDIIAYIKEQGYEFDVLDHKVRDLHY